MRRPKIISRSVARRRFNVCSKACRRSGVEQSWRSLSMPSWGRSGTWRRPREEPRRCSTRSACGYACTIIGTLADHPGLYRCRYGRDYQKISRVCRIKPKPDSRLCIVHFIVCMRLLIVDLCVEDVVFFKFSVSSPSSLITMVYGFVVANCCFFPS